MTSDIVDSAESVADAASGRRPITVYTAGRACMQCALTESVLADLGIPFIECDITLAENASARDYVVGDLGYTQAPVIVVDEHDHWSGFQPDQVRRIASWRASQS